MLININFLQYKNALIIRQQRQQTFVYDPIRRKHLLLQPEELVRQLVLQYLHQEKKYPFQQMRTEKGLIFNELRQRCDVLVYDKQIQPYMLVECKAASVEIDERVFEQIARYNLSLSVPYLMITNGLQTFCCKINYLTATYTFLEEIPTWEYVFQ